MDNLIFVGGFNLGRNPRMYGGQLTACRALLESSLGEKYNFLLIDSAAEVIEGRSLVTRVWQGLRRIFLLLFLLVFKRSKGVLIFTSAGLSFYEKGIMVLLSRLFLKRILLFPRSGLIVDAYEASSFFRTFSRLVVRAADYVICQGEFWKSFFIKLDEKRIDKFLIINNWINVWKFPKHEFIVQPGRKVNFMYLGHFFDYKGIVDLVDVALELEKFNLPFILNVYGDGPLRNHITERINRQLSKSIILHGSVVEAQKPGIFSNNDVFVLPSYREGFPNSLLEAMAAGLAVIANDIGGVSSLVRNKVNGLLITPGKKHALMDAMSYLCNNYNVCKDLGGNARETVIRNNSSEKASSIIQGLIES